MPHTHTHTELLRELAGVSESYTQLSEKLSEVASELRASGIPPTQHLVDELAASRNNFEDLRKRALDLAQELAASTSRRPEEVSSLRELKALLQSLSEAQDKKLADDRIKEQALGILDRTLAIVHRDGIECQPLIECQAKAAELRSAITQMTWPEVHPDVTLLAHRRHPFSELITLVEQCDRLDDDLWLLLKHAVSESFGKALSLAAARGRLIIARAQGRAPAPASVASHEQQNRAATELEDDPDSSGNQRVAVAEGDA